MASDGVFSFLNCGDEMRRDSWLVELCQAEQMGGDWALPAETNYRYFFSKTNILQPKSHPIITAVPCSFTRRQPFSLALPRLPDDAVVVAVVCRASQRRRTKIKRSGVHVHARISVDPIASELLLTNFDKVSALLRSSVTSIVSAHCRNCWIWTLKVSTTCLPTCLGFMWDRINLFIVLLVFLKKKKK